MFYKKRGLAVMIKALMSYKEKRLIAQRGPKSDNYRTDLNHKCSTSVSLEKIPEDLTK